MSRVLRLGKILVNILKLLLISLSFLDDFDTPYDIESETHGLSFSDDQMESYGRKVDNIILFILRMNAKPMTIHLSHNVVEKLWKSFGQDFDNVVEYTSQIIDNEYLRLEFTLSQRIYHANIHYSLGGHNRLFQIWEKVPREDRLNLNRKVTCFDAELHNPFEIYDEMCPY